MPYAKLASFLPLLLIQTAPSDVDDSLPAQIFFKLFFLVFFTLIFLALVAASVSALTLIFGTLSVPPVLGVEWLYRKAVLRWMNEPGSSGGALKESPPAPLKKPAPSELTFELHDPEKSAAPDAGALSRRAEETSGAVTRVYVVAASVCAVALTPLAVYALFAIKDDELFGAVSIGKTSAYLCAFVVLLWLPVLMFLVNAVGRRRRKLYVAVAYSLVFSVSALFMSEDAAAAACFLLISMWGLLMAAPTSALLVMRFSGVGGLALGTLFSVGAMAISLVIQGVAWSEGVTGEPNDQADILAAIGLFVGVPLFVFLLAPLFLWWTGHRYARKRTSEQLLLLDIFWLSTTCLIALIASIGQPGWYVLLAPLAFVLYKLVVWVGLWRLGRRERSDEPELRLLLLRVFGAKRRSEWLLKRLSHYWRYSGSIQLIAAPDLAAANLELDELLDFLRRRTKSRFVKDAADCERRVGALDVRPDRDGRYRVNEFFCHDDVWFETVGALTRQSDAVLMDLRGFTKKNQGCVNELHHLVDAVAVNHLVLIVNDKTDVDFLKQTFEDAWAEMAAHSPNRDLASPVLRLLDIRRQNSRAVRRLLSLLGAAAGDKHAQSRPPVAAQAAEAVEVAPA